MNSKLQYQFNRLEESRNQIVNMISALDEISFHRSIGDKWSIAQILMHIIVSERIAVLYMRKKSLGIDTLKNSGMMEQLKILILKASQRLPLKFKVPTSIKEKTPEAPTRVEVLKLWNDERLKLKMFLESIEDKNIRKLIFKHPIAGMLNASQGVVFLREHLTHHKPQIVKLLPKN